MWRIFCRTFIALQPSIGTSYNPPFIIPGKVNWNDNEKIQSVSREGWYTKAELEALFEALFNRMRMANIDTVSVRLNFFTELNSMAKPFSTIAGPNNRFPEMAT